MHLFKPSYLLTLTVCLLLYFFSHSFLLNQRNSVDSRTFSSMSKWDISPIALKVFTGEFKGLVSDILVLEIGAMIGDQTVQGSDGEWYKLKKEYDWKTIKNMIFLSQSLDPHFDQTLYLVQGWLPWYGFVEEANQFHRQFAYANPWDWRPYHFMGFNTYFFLNDYATAGQLMLEGATIPNTPSFLAILGARISQKGRGVEAAIGLLGSILSNKQLTDPDYVDIKDRYDALKGVYAIETAVKQYTSRYGKIPENLDQLLESKTMTALPPNPYNLNYCLDAKGFVQYDTPQCQ